jgi:pyruvate,water dikinase
MQVLQSYLQIEGPDQAPDAVFQRGAASSASALDELVNRVRQTRGGRFKAQVIRWAIRRMRAMLGLRETPKFGAIRMMGIIRASLLDSGQELVADGWLTRPDDLFFLQLEELKALAAGQERDWTALVHERRQTYAREMRRRQIPRLLLSDGQAFYQGLIAPTEESDGTMVGNAVSAGVVEGVVRVVLDPHKARLEPGEILVCPGTDPAWTPLFLVAGGLVMEVGGMMTHGSVVAREYGIPAVVGVHQATTRLQTGQRVRLDGTAGRVILL